MASFLVITVYSYAEECYIVDAHFETVILSRINAGVVFLGLLRRKGAFFVEIIDVDDKYIEWLRETFPNVLDPKVFHRIHTRKYVGVLFQISEFNYFAPFSSPKAKDFCKNGSIKKDSIFSLHMTKDEKNGSKILLGTIKLINMIPVPSEFQRQYILDDEADEQYKNLVLDEKKWINKNQAKIQSKARTLYFFKKNERKNLNEVNKKIYNSILPFEMIELYIKFNRLNKNKK